MVNPLDVPPKFPPHLTNGQGQDPNGNIQESSSSASSVASHRSHHSSTSSNQENIENRWVFQCGVCGRSFPGQRGLRDAHQLICRPIYRCAVCDRQFLSRRDLRDAHQRNCQPNPFFGGQHQQHGQNNSNSSSSN